jgi:peptidoglycan-associated lipoprotein
MRFRLGLTCIAAFLLLPGTAFAQTNPAPNSANPGTMRATSPESNEVPAPQDAVPDAKNTGAVIEDPNGRTIQTTSTPEVAPPPAPAPQRQEFQQNVKDVYFDFNGADLTAEDRATLQKDADWLKAHPNAFFTIAGGADERGEIPYNLFLSDQRALVTRDALVREGVPENQILFATGWGKLYPVCTQSDESCWSQNRRSHLAPWPPAGENPLGTSAAEHNPQGPAMLSGAAR